MFAVMTAAAQHFEIALIVSALAEHAALIDVMHDERALHAATVAAIAGAPERERSRLPPACVAIRVH